MWRKLLVVTLAVVLVGMVGFSQVRNPDTMTYLTIGQPETLDPHYMYDTSSSQAVNNMYDSLIQYDGATIYFKPMISLEVPTIENGLIREGGKVYEFPLREGVKFHSGHTLTPYDVKWSLERAILFDRAGGPMGELIKALSGGVYSTIRSWFTGYSGMEWDEAVTPERMVVSAEARQKLIDFYNEVIDPIIVIDGNSVIFNLPVPSGAFLNFVTHYCGWAVIVDSQWGIENGAWDGQADGWWRWNNLTPTETPFHTQVAGSGPFKLVEWDQGTQRLLFERFDDYWQGPAAMKNVIIWGIDEYSTRKAIFMAGDADFIYVPNENVVEFENIPGIRVETGHPQYSVTSTHMNWNVDPRSEYLFSGKLDGRGIPPDFFSCIHVRRALKHIINYDAYIQEVLYGIGQVIPAELPAGYLGYDDTLPKPRFDLALAERELKQAWDGKVWEVGFVMPALYNTGNVMRQTAAEMTKVYLESLNPKFRVEPIGLMWPTYLAAGNANMLPYFFIGWAASHSDPDYFIFHYYHSRGTYPAWRGQGYRDFCEEHLDHLIEAALLEPDLEKRHDMYVEIQQIAIDNVLATPLYNVVGIQVFQDWVKGWQPHPLRSPDLSFYPLSK